MLHLHRTDSDDEDFIALVKQLDADLARRDGTEHAFYNQFNKIDKIRYALVAYEAGHPLGCGAMKQLSPGIMEIKRMYTAPESRGKGVATGVLAALETWAIELGYHTCQLETGKRQPEAIRLYEQKGYHTVSNYGQYAGIENSVCFEKKLS